MATDHFEKHFYQKNRVDWNFNLLFDGQPAVAQMAQHYAPALDHPGLYDPIPPQWLHSTILRMGLVNEFADTEMLAVADALAPKLAQLQLPEFVFDPWWLVDGNVVLHISPNTRYRELYTSVAEAMHEIVGPKRTLDAPHGFIAHMTLAYTRTHDQEHEIHDRLIAHPVSPATFHATHLALIRQWPTAGHYEWDIVRKLPIGIHKPSIL